jgi:hypothetical protein
MSLDMMIQYIPQQQGFRLQLLIAITTERGATIGASPARAHKVCIASAAIAPVAVASGDRRFERG